VPRDTPVFTEVLPGAFTVLGVLRTIVAMHPVTATTAALGLLVTGGAAGAALAGRPDRAGVAATPSRPAPVEVRTEVIHRTVHVVRHIRPSTGPRRPRRPRPSRPRRRRRSAWR
jgi:hypothetical protein